MASQCATATVRRKSKAAWYQGRMRTTAPKDGVTHTHLASVGVEGEVAVLEDVQNIRRWRRYRSLWGCRGKWRCRSGRFGDRRRGRGMTCRGRRRGRGLTCRGGRGGRGLTCQGGRRYYDPNTIVVVSVRHFLSIIVNEEARRLIQPSVHDLIG